MDGRVGGHRRHCVYPALRGLVGATPVRGRWLGEERAKLLTLDPKSRTPTLDPVSNGIGMPYTHRRGTVTPSVGPSGSCVAFLPNAADRKNTMDKSSCALIEQCQTRVRARRFQTRQNQEPPFEVGELRGARGPTFAVKIGVRRRTFSGISIRSGPRSPTGSSSA